MFNSFKTIFPGSLRNKEEFGPNVILLLEITQNEISGRPTKYVYSKTQRQRKALKSSTCVNGGKSKWSQQNLCRRPCWSDREEWECGGDPVMADANNHQHIHIPRRRKPCSEWELGMNRKSLLWEIKILCPPDRPQKAHPSKRRHIHWKKGLCTSVAASSDKAGVAQNGCIRTHISYKDLDKAHPDRRGCVPARMVGFLPGLPSWHGNVDSQQAVWLLNYQCDKGLVTNSCPFLCLGATAEGTVW